MRLFSIFVLISAFISACSKTDKTTFAGQKIVQLPAEEKPIFTIAFGSCNKSDKPQPLWEDIIAEDPDLWIWLGDNVYGDTEDMSKLKAKYDRQLSQPDYQILKTQTEIIGTWDDHDYGINDGDKNFPKKQESRDLALDFLGVSKDHPMRAREGLFQSYAYHVDTMIIRVILLDTRYFRDYVAKDGKKYVPDPNADILGSEQWNWLSYELQKEEDILIIAGGIQFISEEHRFEKWANFPKSRERLFLMLEQDDSDRVILLSGDRHIGEISQINRQHKTLTELTSSGLTHSYTRVGNEANKYRIGNLTGQKNYGLIQIFKDGSTNGIICGEERVRRNLVEL